MHHKQRWHATLSFIVWSAAALCSVWPIIRQLMKELLRVDTTWPVFFGGGRRFVRDWFLVGDSNTSSKPHARATSVYDRVCVYDRKSEKNGWIEQEGSLCADCSSRCVDNCAGMWFTTGTFAEVKPALGDPKRTCALWSRWEGHCNNKKNKIQLYVCVCLCGKTSPKERRNGIIINESARAPCSWWYRFASSNWIDPKEDTSVPSTENLSTAGPEAFRIISARCLQLKALSRCVMLFFRTGF